MCVCGGGGVRRCSVNKDQHFRGVCGGGGGGFVPQTQYSKLTNKS